MKILVTGNPRSGTLSMKNMLRAAGYDVEHERSGSEGTVSCFFFCEAPYYPREKLTARRHRGEKFNLDDYDVIVHLVRNPLHCIPSMAKVVGTGHQQWLEDIGVLQQFRPKMSWAAAAWYHTNMVINKQFSDKLYHIVQIEHVLNQWPAELCKPPEVLHQHKGSGLRKSKPLTKAQLAEWTPLHNHIIQMARDYGYTL